MCFELRESGSTFWQDCFGSFEKYPVRGPSKGPTNNQLFPVWKILLPFCGSLIWSQGFLPDTDSLFCRNATPSYHFSTTSGKTFFFVKLIFYKVICLVFFNSPEEIWISRDVIDSSFYSVAKEFISEMLFMKFPTLWISHFPSNEEGDNHWLLTSNH